MKNEIKILRRAPLLLFLVYCSCLKEVPKVATEIVEEQNSVSCENTPYDNWESSEYVLPYPVGKTYSISLSHCSGSYHSEGEPDQFAIDFIMRIGTPITASRAGEVVFIEESGYDGGFPNNKVVVQHADGTYLQYMHLTYDGAAVNVGAYLKKGQLVGYSGNTGLAGFPHLHFVATKSGSWEYPYTSFPTTFSNTEKNEFSLQQGKSYKALRY
ncbi:M23 family metallopeptidase [Maribacter algarum]|uniref:M23 family metallopeptidase n=1 Tax=Maribacter algarum (ex Zhang et al. 2020) TaxID=2578118 RepID=A0A5S3PGU1_9FLAO|nr:M23 family metallopeptidase [Maribacter algarum]TMM53358.1 M23 family metallopeptidase [Maribacter algarum]